MINLQRSFSECYFDFLGNIKKRALYHGYKIDFSRKLIKKYKNYKGLAQKDYSYLADEIISVMSDSFDDDVYPFFGTLLSIMRDNKFNFADDFDFATTKNSILSLTSIDKLEKLGFFFYRYAYIENVGVVELSFLYKGANVDIFLLKQSVNKITHNCPNFRTGFGTKEENSSFLMVKYQDYFKVDYPRYNLQYSDDWKVWLPSESKGIFEAHYGKDWETPKENNFIDFSNYKFIKCRSITLETKLLCNKSLKRELEKSLKC